MLQGPEGSFMILVGEIEMDEVVMEKLLAGVAKATASAIREELAPMPRHRGPSWVAVGTMALAMVGPMVGYQLSLSNRVAVLEAKSTDLANAATQLATLTQKVEDFQREFEEYRKEEARRP